MAPNIGLVNPAHIGWDPPTEYPEEIDPGFYERALRPLIETKESVTLEKLRLTLTNLAAPAGPAIPTDPTALQSATAFMGWAENVWRQRRLSPAQPMALVID